MNPFRFFHPSGRFSWRRIVAFAISAVFTLLALMWLFSTNSAPIQPQSIADQVADPVVAALNADATVFLVGSNPDAPLAYVFEDPNCSFCARFDRAAKPLVDSGRLRLKVVLVAFLKPSSAGRAASIFRAKNPAQALERNADQFHALGEDGGIAPVEPTQEDRAHLARHMDLLRRIGEVRTPTILFRRGNGWVAVSGFQPSIFDAIAAPARIPQADLPTTTLRVNGSEVIAEIARTKDQMEVGLMGRTSLPENHGMLFVFDRPQVVCMWMKNTLIPLSVAFLDSHKRVINTEDMQPDTLNSHCSKTLASYALEMPLGWFVQHHVSDGSVVRGEFH